MLPLQLSDASAFELLDYNEKETNVMEETNSTPDVMWLTTFLTNVDIDDLSDADANVAYFVSGYIGRSVSCRRGCLSCKHLLVQDHDAFLCSRLCTRRA